MIELKGSDKSHACSQIYTTFNYFIKNFAAKKWHARVVLSKNRAPNLSSSNEKRLKDVFFRDEIEKEDE